MSRYLQVWFWTTIILLPGQTLQASPVSTRLNKVYKELVIQGERPEVSSCMALAFKASRENGPYEQIYYSADVQDSALFQEDSNDGPLVKVITLYAKAQPRQGSFFIKSATEKIQIICTQVDEGVPVVRFKSLGND